MFGKPAYVFKDGELVARDGAIVKVTWGNTHVVKPQYDAAIERRIEPYFERYHTMRMGNFKISDDEMCECGHGSRLIHHNCRKQ